MMKYEWERRVPTSAAIDAADLLMPPGLEIVGIAVIHTETGEAALLAPGAKTGSVSECDYWHDISGDATTHYADSMRVARIEFYAQRAKASRNETVE